MTNGPTGVPAEDEWFISNVNAPRTNSDTSIGFDLNEDDAIEMPWRNGARFACPLLPVWGITNVGFLLIALLIISSRAFLDQQAER